MVVYLSKRQVNFILVQQHYFANGCIEFMAPENESIYSSLHIIEWSHLIAGLDHGLDCGLAHWTGLQK